MPEDSYMPKSPWLSTMTYGPNMPTRIATGNPTVDMLMNILMGGMNLANSSSPGQSVYDVSQQRQRSRQYLDLMKHQFGSSLLFQKLGGLNVDSGFGNIASMMMGRPDGIMDHPLMRAFNGGNPVKAAMGLHSNMTGLTMGMLTGQIRNATPDETSRTMRQAMRALYETKVFNNEAFEDEVATRSSSYVNNPAFQVYRKKDRANRDIIDYDLVRKVKERNEADTKRGIPTDKVSDDLQQFLNAPNADGEFSVNNDALKKAGKRIKVDADFRKKMKESGILDESGYEPEIDTNFTTALLQNRLGGKKVEELTKKVNADAEYIQQIKGRRGEIEYTRTNVEATRGYELQDITRSYAMAADYGMYRYKHKNADDKGSFGNYAKNAIAPLRAVGDMFGTDKADEAMDIMNSLVGNSTLDLGKDNEAGKVTDLFRRFKASALAAGVSIEAVTGILAEAKALSARHPMMRYQGGLPMIETSINALTSASVMSATLGPGFVRRQGGTKEVQRQVTSAVIANDSQPIMAQIGGMAALIDNEKDPRKKAEARKILNDLVSDPNQSYSPQDILPAKEKISRILGYTTPQMNQALVSPLLQQEALPAIEKLRQEKTEKGEQAYSGFTRDMSTRLRGQNLDNRLLLTSYMVGEENLPPIEGLVGDTPNERLQSRLKATHEALSRMAISGDSFEGIMSRYYGTAAIGSNMFNPETEVGQDEKTTMLLQSAKYKPEYNIETAKMESWISSYARTDEEISKKSKLQGPFLNTLAQLMISHGFEHGIGQLKTVLTDTKLQTKGTALLRAAENSYKLKSVDAFSNVYLEAHGGSKLTESDIDVRKSLAHEGNSPEEIDKIMLQRKAMLEGKGTLDDMVASVPDITLNNLTQATKDETTFNLSDLSKQFTWKDKGEKWSKFIKDTGFLNSDDTLKMYGNRTLKDSLGDIGQRMGIDETKTMTIRSQQKAIEDNFSKNFKGLLSDYEVFDEKDEKGSKERQAALSHWMDAWDQMGLIPHDASGKRKGIKDIDTNKLIKAAGHDPFSDLFLSEAVSAGIAPASMTASKGYHVNPDDISKWDTMIVDVKDKELLAREGYGVMENDTFKPSKDSIERADRSNSYSEVAKKVLSKYKLGEVRKSLSSSQIDEIIKRNKEGTLSPGLADALLSVNYDGEPVAKNIDGKIVIDDKRLRQAGASAAWQSDSIGRGGRAEELMSTAVEAVKQLGELKSQEDAEKYVKIDQKTMMELVEKLGLQGTGIGDAILKLNTSLQTALGMAPR